jgi:tRNA1(Val) A37 N6-methylase TrmN6
MKDSDLERANGVEIYQAGGLQSVCWKCSGTGLKPVKKSLVALGIKCLVCNGTGMQKPKPAVAQHKPYRPFKTQGWVIPGPKAKYEMYDEVVKPECGVMLTALSGHWCIYQIEDGHRITTDDVACAAIAIQMTQKYNVNVPVHLDIGCGLGSVLTMVHWALHSSIIQSIGIEAQSIHVELARKTLEFNGITEKCQIYHRDLRDVAMGDLDNQKFKLITGTPPYFSLTTGSVPVVAGRGMCAFEFRGGIDLYCKVASFFLEDDGLFVVTNTTFEASRTVEAGIAVGLHLVEQIDFHGRQGKESLFSVFVFRKKQHVLEKTHRAIFIRDMNGQYSPQYNELTFLVGKPPPRFEQASIPKLKTAQAKGSSI